ncbi:aldo/keto reductase [Pestalotiopsis sp. NC0098]|nr:aldo/keto reductase [Pestalotiopsis sp. NC0098]
MTTEAEKLSLTSTVALRDSDARLPVLGFGVYQIDRADTTAACLRALAAGYRHIDTAQLYQNEAEVGAALRQSGLARADIFVATKIRYPRLGKGKTYQRALQSVEKIDPGPEGYVDLFLVHTPYGISAKDRREIWLALERLHDEGRARAIGMRTYASVWPPAVNQILLHPWTQQRQTIDYCNEHGIVLEAHTPLARGARWNDPTVSEIAEKLNKSPAQILIRYCLQKGWVPLPRSEREERVRENADVFDFEIPEDDMAALDGLDGQQIPV